MSVWERKPVREDGHWRWKERRLARSDFWRETRLRQPEGPNWPTEGPSTDFNPHGLLAFFFFLPSTEFPQRKWLRARFFLLAWRGRLRCDGIKTSESWLLRNAALDQWMKRGSSFKIYFRIEIFNFLSGFYDFPRTHPEYLEILSRLFLFQNWFNCPNVRWSRINPLENEQQ